MQQEIPQLRFATARLATGLRVHYAEQGEPGGDTILFLPGYTDSWFSYSRVLPLLPARYQAYAVDQRGHGESERPDCCYAVDDFAADVVAFLDVVGAARATLVGHSAGCLVARRVAEVDPERVARLVLLGSPGSLGDNEEELELKEAVHGLEDPVPLQFARELQGAAAHVRLPEEFFDGLVAESLKLPARVWKSALEGLFAFDDATDRGRIAAPTLCIWGEWDRWLPREEEDDLAAAIPGARVVVYPATGHSPNWERPERVAADLDAFMREG
jgi:pimeloyl-ACP methyl ester carboxylesterase